MWKHTALNASFKNLSKLPVSDVNRFRASWSKSSLDIWKQPMYSSGLSFQANTSQIFKMVTQTSCTERPLVYGIKFCYTTAMTFQQKFLQIQKSLQTFITSLLEWKLLTLTLHLFALTSNNLYNNKPNRSVHLSQTVKLCLDM